jgi:hypothetical protein
VRQKLTRKDTEPASPEINLDNPAMDIDQGDTNSPNPCSTGLRDTYVLYYVSISTHPASGDYQVPGTPTMPLLGASYTDAIPANARSSETGYPLNQYGSFRRSSREKEKTVSDQMALNELENYLVWQCRSVVLS